MMRDRTSDHDQLREKVEVLDGTRTKDIRKKAAVRIEDLSELLRIQPVRATPVSAAPTAEEYNALLKDIEEVNSRLNVIAQALQARLLR